MKNTLSLCFLGSLLFISSVSAQDPVTNAPAPQSIADAVNTLRGWLLSNNPNATNLFSDSEIDLKLGGVYSQSTGEAGALLDVTDWGLIAPNVGIGASVIEGNQSGKSGTAAAYAHIGYRRVIGNVAGSLFIGPGYDFDRQHLMGVIGAEAEYRWTAHVGAFVSAGYGISGDKSNDRGLILGGGFKYDF